ncbi:hypothetical protein [Algibacter mikhailovii]|uniref:Lipocalin-like domain-containing protein n=1 Tax=Algibacter mikhailovii TaxID=425498 RepID=A0A918QXD8_9FLAO|nr:hypothetical protein [Algibacter mikhailovii]GGZ71304.1 hypothetical protein GCM10007028_05680 [Algibacter mikhailovii]
MKAFSPILVFLILLITSCSSDDAETSVNENIIGTWIGTDLRVSGEIETERGGESVITILSGEGYDLTNTLVFSPSPNLVASAGELNMIISYTTDDDVIFEDIKGFELLGEGTWEIQGSELIITDPNEVVEEDVEEEDGEERIVRVYKLTNKELVIGIVEKEEDIEDDVTTTSLIETVLSFIRQ